MIVIGVVVKHINRSIVGPCIDSNRVHPWVDLMSGPDQNGQKADLEYPPPSLLMPNLGESKTQQKSRIWIFLNVPIHPGLNSEGIGWVNYLLTRSHS